MEINGREKKADVTKQIVNIRAIGPSLPTSTHLEVGLVVLGAVLSIQHAVGALGALMVLDN